MSTTTIETRMCDECGAIYEAANMAWMILNFPNVEQQAPEPIFDFCTYECLQSWVNKEDEDEIVSDESDGVSGAQALAEQSELDVPIGFVPTMTLAEAIALGLKPSAQS